MQANNGQSQSDFTNQPTSNIKGTNSASPPHFSATMHVAHHNAHNPHGHQVQPTGSFAVQQQMNGNLQLAPQGQQPLQLFNSHQPRSSNSWAPATSMVLNNPAVMAEISQIFGALSRRPEQVQHIQNYMVNQQIGDSQHCYQAPQQSSGPQQYQNLLGNQNYSTLHHTDSAYASSSGDNTPIVDPAHLPENHTNNSASHSTLAPSHLNNAGTPESAQSSTGTELPEGFQGQVNDLVQQKGTDYAGHIRNKADALRYKQAVWKSKIRGDNYNQRCHDYPTDEAGEMRVRQRIFEAIVNLDGNQDPVSDSGNFLNSLAVRTVQSLSRVEVELLADDLMVSSTVTLPG
jgi:hypothetical protein